MSLIGTLTSGVSALRSFTKGLEVIGNNIANVNTVGYKSSQASFADSFSNTLRGSAPSNGTTPNQSSIQVGTGVRIAGITSNYGQGALTTTGVGSDLGVSGNGFFRVVNTVDGQEYASRAGNFRFDDQGYLVTSEGYRVQGLTGGTSSSAPGTVGDIRLNTTPPTGTELQSYSVDRLGNVVEFYSDGSSLTSNRLLLQNYTDPSALQKEGNNLYTGFSAAGAIGGVALTAANGAGQNGLGTIESGTLELSNVDLTEEFANMITTQRSFQASSRLVTVSDSVLEDIVNLKR
ncbi:flagellar hook-basal body protein [Rariglobus hedericola]|uniref:Flagellar hook protein FlgE n=1 Tax=Rariglobus hedericola TaxID=2597822 RepID=A0A556QPT8_9BACT|nr:flagellar hook-basal body complex protein [Rariglobus hedericola]TSJ78651.1 flagellar hook-basal body complex protein [Rariglobus hedericola]